MAELAARQWGVVTWAQLVESGLGPAGISRWIDERRLHRIHPGVYAVGHLALGMEARMAAALFYAGPGAALSHVTAAWWWGMLQTEPRRLHVCVPGRRRSLRHVRVHARRDRSGRGTSAFPLPHLLRRSWTSPASCASWSCAARWPRPSTGGS